MLDKLVVAEISAGYKSGRVGGDGNCQFRSSRHCAPPCSKTSSTRTYSPVSTTHSLRKRVVHWLEENGDTKFEGPGSSLRARHDVLLGTRWVTYLARMRRHEADESGKVEWGNETTLMAFSCLFNLTVKVFNIKSVVVMSTIPRPTVLVDASSSIMYLGYKPECHYVPILPVAQPQLALELAEQAAAGAGAVEMTNSFAVAARQLASAPHTTPPRAGSECETGTFSHQCGSTRARPRSRHRQKVGAPPSERARRQRAPRSRRSSKSAARGSVSTAPRRALVRDADTLKRQHRVNH